MIYVDTSLLAKQYLSEPDSGAIRNFLVRMNQIIVNSELGRMEMAATFHRKLREGQVSAVQFASLRLQLESDVLGGRIRWLPLTQTTIESVELAFSRFPATVFLRTGDAIHLATASEAGFKEIYSNDRHLLAAAPLFKLKGINPLAKS